MDPYGKGYCAYEINQPQLGLGRNEMSASVTCKSK
mgnify:FL=1